MKTSTQPETAALQVALVIPEGTPWPGILVPQLVPSLARSLGERGHRVHVVCPVHDPSKPVGLHDEFRAGLLVRTLNLPGGTLPAEAWALWQQAVGSADLVHLYAAGRGFGEWFEPLAEWKPLLMTLLDPPEISTKLGKTRWQRELDAAALVVVPSRTLLVRLADRLRLDPIRTRILEPGLFYGYPQGTSRARHWTGSGPLRILHLGLRTQHSGIEDLIEALDRLPGGSVQLCCFGPRGPEGRVGDLARISHRVPMAMAGRLEPGALTQVASTCHVAAFPSRGLGGYPLPIDEALALGLPVMASECGAAMERYGEGPIQALPAGDVEAWCAAFQRHLRNPGTLQRAQAAVPDRITSAQSSAASLETLYRHALRQRAA